MKHCLVQLKDQIVIRGYRFLPLVKNMGKYSGKNRNKT